MEARALADAARQKRSNPVDDDTLMALAIDVAESARYRAHPNPWVGAAIIAPDHSVHVGATEAPGSAHAEIGALAAAGALARGATMAVTLEPCSFHGRTPPCVDALVDAGVARVIIGVLDPDHRVAGQGADRLRAAGIDVVVGVRQAEVETQLAPYLHHRRTGRPWVVLKLASTLDGRIGAPDGSSQWITGTDARADAHRLRAESDAILVGVGTVRADNPSLTVRHVDGPDPLRVVLGTPPLDAKVHPCRSYDEPIDAVLDDLGRDGLVQVLVEGGAGVAGDIHRAGLVDHYVIYLAPALMGGDDALPVMRGAGAATIADIWRGRITNVTHLGDDLRIDVEPAGSARALDTPSRS
jgi:diaminohydroxyphosphoribosylaminopyrimidine deaminase/5-amino-6-(5-phosphoribosylamino)uracil reductase